MGGYVSRLRDDMTAANRELEAAKDAAEAAAPRQEHVPREHEPRDPHADERRHRHDHAAARHEPDGARSASTSR